MLRAIKLSKSFHSQCLFADVSFTINKGDRIGFVGPNGAGKSTMLRLLVGAEAPTSGRVEQAPGTRVGFLPQQVFDPRATVGEVFRAGAGELPAVADEMHALAARVAAGEQSAVAAYGQVQDRWLALRGWTYDSRAAEVRQHLGVAHLPDSQRMAELSGGEQARILLASVLLSEPSVLILDEPTNHLDAEGIDWLAGYLRRFPGGVLVVTHDREFLDRTVSRVFELDGVHDTLQTYTGGYLEYRVEKARRWAAAQLAYEAQEKRHRQLVEGIALVKEQARAKEAASANDRSRRHARMLARKAIMRERRLVRQVNSDAWLAQPVARARFALAFAAADDRPEPVLSACDLTVGTGPTTIVTGIDLTVERGDRIVLSGRNGIGKTSLLRTLAGRQPPLGGTLRTAADVALLPQTHDDLRTGRPAIDYFRSRSPMYLDDAEELLQDYLFDLDQQRQPMCSLSAGELRRLLLAVIVHGGADLLLLDEPTNYLDFDSLEVVEEALRAFPGTLIMVTHDRRFADQVGFNRHLSLAAGGLVEAGATPAPTGAGRER